MNLHRRSSLRGVFALSCTLITVIASATPAFAYLKLGYETPFGSQVSLKWVSTPVRYYVTNAGVSGVSATDFQTAVRRAFDTWQAVPTAKITYQFAAFTASRPGQDDGRSTLGFLNEPELERVLAATSFLIDVITGEIVESDIFFNSSFAWSVSAAGTPGRFDLESIALHEIGHFSGLGHSAIGETDVTSRGRRVLSIGSVMFPIALGTGDISGRTLRPDDIAGLSDLYPEAEFNQTTGSVSGRITKNGSGVFGAHAVAFDIARGELVSNFTLSRTGSFSIAGLQPGVHVIRVEPVDDADVESFFDVGDPVDLNFRIKYYEQLVVVPRGSDSGTVNITVVPK